MSQNEISKVRGFIKKNLSKWCGRRIEWMVVAYKRDGKGDSMKERGDKE